MKIKTLIYDIELKKDINGKNYWIIRTRLENLNKKSYLAFSTDYNLSKKTLSFLNNLPKRKMSEMKALLTIKNNSVGNQKVFLDKIVNIEITK